MPKNCANKNVSMRLPLQGCKNRHALTDTHQADDIGQLGHWNQLLGYTVAGLAVGADADSHQHSISINSRVRGIRINSA